MRRSPEALIAGLRNRKRRIVTYSVLAVIFLGLAAIALFVASRAYAGLVPREGEKLVFRAALDHLMLVGIARMQTIAIVFAIAFGLAGAALLIEIMEFTRSDLLVYLWDRVQALEKAQATATNTGQSQAPASPNQPSSDT